MLGQPARRPSGSIVHAMLDGAVAGILAALVMDGLDKSFFSTGGNGARRGDQPGHRDRSLPSAVLPEEAPRLADETPTQRAISALATAVGAELSREQRHTGAAILHLGFGAVMGAAYGAIAAVSPVVTRGLGIPYGVAVWLAADHLGLSILGLERPPRQRPIKMHARTLLTHAMYGATLDLARRGLRSVLRAPCAGNERAQGANAGREFPGRKTIRLAS